MFERAMLLGKLETVAPALADNDMVPLFTHFIFTGAKLMAYCERMAISVPLKTEFKGAVPGKIMMMMLGASSAKNVELSASGNGLKIRAGGANINLPMLSVDNIFQMPAKAEESNSLPSEPTKFFVAIDDCLQSVMQYSTQADMLGITIIPNGGRASLFSTDNKTLSHATFKLKGKFAKRVILPADFCRQMLRLQKEADNIALEVRDNYAIFSAGSNHLYGKLLQSNNQLDYEQILKRVKVEHTDKSMCEKPKDFEKLLDRAVLITDVAGRSIKTKVNVEGGKARFESESERGKVVDTVSFKHPTITVSLDPKIWRSGYDRYEKFKITEKAVVMTHSTGLFAVGTGS